MKFRRADIGRFLYWSDRAIASHAEHNGVQLDDRRQIAYAAGITKVASLTIDPSPVVTRNKLREVRSIFERLRPASITQGEVSELLAYGAGRVEFADFVVPGAINQGVVLYTRTRSYTGTRVDVCMFGSVDGLDGFISDGAHSSLGWTSSSADLIVRMLQNRGNAVAGEMDDRAYCATEALKIALYQGSTELDDRIHEGRPESRHFTLGRADECEYMIEVFIDITLSDDQRMALSGEMALSQRIIVGRPLWVRTMNPRSVRRYQQSERASFRRRQRWAHRAVARLRSRRW
ncbi:hypothetical protein [Nocardia sp. NBC_00403]|uniref:hypothetical protein n=1 Tax=Nocardia sp. NBC_00403 TaxID=2975990 RepID=UPI002E1A4CC0